MQKRHSTTLRHPCAQTCSGYQQGREDGRAEAIEEAAALCRETGDAYRNLQVRAREDKDTQSAFAHLVEKDTCFLLAADIEKLKFRTQSKEKK